VSTSSARLSRPRTTAAPRLGLVRRRSRNLIRREGSTRTAPIWIVSGLCVLLAVFGVLLEQVVLAQSAFELGRVREDVVAAEAHHQELLLEATKLGSPGRIERYAREDLGMVDSAEVGYIVAEVHGAADKPTPRRARRPETLSDPGFATATGEFTGTEVP
jgi:cell division protein FtsL